MSARIVAFLRRATSRDWTSQELAEFYRVESALIQAGLRVCSDRGVTDEGDPWFVFCHAEDDDGDVIVHFARIGGQYLISAPSHGGDVRGHDFRELVRGLVERHPALRTVRRGDNVTLHPSALLVVLVASALLKTTHSAEAASARSNETPPNGAVRTPGRVSVGIPEHATGAVSQETQDGTATLAAIAFATFSVHEQSVPTVVASAVDSSVPDHAALPFRLSLDSSLAVGHSGSDSVIQVSPHVPSPGMDAGVPFHAFVALQTQTTPLATGLVVLGDKGALPVTLSNSPLVAAPSVAWHSGQAMSDGQHPGTQDVAASLLSDLGGNVQVVYANTLPADLVAPLHNSVHTAVANFVATSPSPVTAPTPPTTVSESHLSATSSTNTTVTTTVEPATVVTHASNTPAQVVAAPSLPAVLGIMLNFEQEVGSHLAVVTTTNQVVVYDSYAIDHSSGPVSSVTYDFADGSHLSLVGLPSEVLHAQM